MCMLCLLVDLPASKNIHSHFSLMSEDMCAQHQQMYIIQMHISHKRMHLHMYSVFVYALSARKIYNTVQPPIMFIIMRASESNFSKCTKTREF